jgi:hypothetical protein
METVHASIGIDTAYPQQEVQMKSGILSRTFALVLLVDILGGSGAAFSQEESLQAELDALREQVKELDNVAVRTQSHIMIDVEYHFANLWFAVQNQQWDLAAFYLRETNSHLGWTVRVRPVRTLRTGGTVELQPFQESIQKGGFSQLEKALTDHDAESFAMSYQQTLTQCHACHEAAGLGYLEPKVPEQPTSPLMLHRTQ